MQVVVNRSACFDVTPPPSTSKPSETEQTTPETSASTASEAEPSPTAGNLMSLSSLSMHELERIRERARARHEMRKLKAMCEEVACWNPSPPYPPQPLRHAVCYGAVA